MKSLPKKTFSISLIAFVTISANAQTIDQNGKNNTQNIDIKRSGTIQFNGGQNVYLLNQTDDAPKFEYYKEDIGGVYYGVKNNGTCHISFNCINTSPSEAFDFSAKMYLIGQNSSSIFVLKEQSNDDYIIPKLGYKDQYGDGMFIDKLPTNSDTVFFLAIKYEYSNKLLVKQPVRLDIFSLDPNKTYEELEPVNSLLHDKILDYLSAKK